MRWKLDKSTVDNAMRNFARRDSLGCNNRSPALNSDGSRYEGKSATFLVEAGTNRREPAGAKPFFGSSGGASI